MIEIDGSLGAGGGQVLRLALALSLITNQPFRMHSIRTARPSPGLKEQQLQILAVLTEISSSFVSGNAKGSESIVFSPGTVWGGHIDIRANTPVSIPLLLQTLIPVASLAERPLSFEIQGGTDIDNSMSFDYFRAVIAPYIGGVNARVLRRGFFPSCDGAVTGSLRKPATSRITLKGGTPVKSVRLISAASRSLRPFGVAERQIVGALGSLRFHAQTVEASHRYYEASSDGGVITLVATLEGGERLGAHSLLEDLSQPEQAGRDAAKMLSNEVASAAGVDRYAADNLIPWLALRGGEMSVSCITEHTRAALEICAQFLGPTLFVSGNEIRTMTT